MNICLAGYETQYAGYGLVLPKETNLFLSYYYQKKVDKTLPILKPKGHKGTIIIDSGAHSFFSFIGLSVTSGFFKSKGQQKDPEIYFKKYLKWLVANYSYYDYFVELDLQEIVGYEKIEEWRKEYKSKGVFSKCILVYHSVDGWDKFKKIINDSKCKYIGIEGIRLNIPMLPYNKYIKYAYDNNCKIHGFAFTRMQLLHTYPFFSVPFFSVDSSSWTVGSRYGCLQMFVNGCMKTLKSPLDKRNKMTKEKQKSKFLGYKLDIRMLGGHRDNTKREIIVKKLLHGAIQYLKLQKYITNIWCKRNIIWKI